MSGNKPPWTLPAKAAYGVFDTERAKRYFGTQDIRTPEFFPILSILVSSETHGLVASFNGRFPRDTKSFPLYGCLIR
jgi:hypothetical protein